MAVNSMDWFHYPAFLAFSRLPQTHTEKKRMSVYEYEYEDECVSPRTGAWEYHYLFLEDTRVIFDTTSTQQTQSQFKPVVLELCVMRWEAE